MHNSPTLLLVTSLVSIVDVKGKTKRSTYETISYDKLFKNKRCNEIPRDLDNHASKDIIHGNQSLIPFLGFGGDPTSHVTSTKRVPCLHQYWAPHPRLVRRRTPPPTKCLSWWTSRHVTVPSWRGNKR